jgi:hypothetical protein
MTEPNTTVYEKINIPYHLPAPCVFAVRNTNATRSDDAETLQPLQSPGNSSPATCGACRQVNTSIYRQACEFTRNIPYHLRPRCVFALRTTNATRSDAGTLQPPQSPRNYSLVTCGAYRQVNRSIYRQVCGFTNKVLKITRTHFLTPPRADRAK